MRVACGEHQDAELLGRRRGVAAAKVGEHEPRRKRATRARRGVNRGDVFVRAPLERVEELGRAGTPRASRDRRFVRGFVHGVGGLFRRLELARRRRHERGGERLDGVHETRRVRHRRALRDGAELRDGGGDDLRVVTESASRVVSVHAHHSAEHGDLLARGGGVSPRAPHRVVPVAVRALERPGKVEGERAAFPPGNADRRQAARARARRQRRERRDGTLGGAGAVRGDAAAGPAPAPAPLATRTRCRIGGGPRPEPDGVRPRPERPASAPVAVIRAVRAAAAAVGQAAAAARVQPRTHHSVRARGLLR